MVEIDRIKFDEIEKEIVRQMGVDTITQAVLKGDWEKVDPEIVKAYNEFVASRIDETFRIINTGTSYEILAKIETSDSPKAFLIIEES